MIYAYAVCERPAADPPPRRRGLGGAALRALEEGGLAAVYSRHRALRAQPSRETLLAHERVVEAVMARGAVLPLRFGTAVEDERHLAAVLRERHDELVRGLERVRGRVEIGVRALALSEGGVAGQRAAGGQRAAAGQRAVGGQRAAAGQRAVGGQRAAGDPQSERSGRDYLLARAREHRRAERAARELHAPLAALAFDSRMREAPAAPAVLNASYLVDAARAGDFRARIDELAAAQDDLRVLVTGPWPPYSFAPEGRS